MIVIVIVIVMIKMTKMMIAEGVCEWSRYFVRRGWEDGVGERQNGWSWS